MVVTYAMKVSSFDDVDRYSKEDSYHKAVYFEKEEVGMFVEEIREEDHTPS
jgi:hypothetical protein